MNDPTLPATCRRVQEHLPRFVAGEASRLRTFLVERHLVKCDACAAEHARQGEVDRRLRLLAPVVEEAVDAAEPPTWLLDNLLEQAGDRNLRSRAAAPARGAISGARPGLSVAAVVVTALVAGTLGWASWRLGRRLAGAGGHGRDHRA